MTASELAKICHDRLGWKRPATYTVMKRLGARSVLKNDNGIVTSLVSKGEVQRMIDHIREGGKGKRRVCF